MKNLLIITHFYPPYNSIATLRPVSWVKYLKTTYNITVLTRHYTGNEQSFSDTINPVIKETTISHEDGVQIIRVPYNNAFYNWFQKSWLHQNKITRGFIYFINIILGRLLIQQNNNNEYQKQLDVLLNKQHFDIMLCTVSPENLIQLCYKANKKYKIPFIVDIRDWFFMPEIKKDFKPTIKSKLAFGIQKIYLKKWLKNAIGITAVNSFILDQLNNLKLPTLVIHNGFDDAVTENSALPMASNNKFTFTVLGTLYPEQDINFMVKGINLFLQKHDIPPKAVFNFIGTNNIKNVSNIIIENIPPAFLNITDRVPRNEAMAVIKATHILFHIGWFGYSGIYSGKIFEYLGTKKNILIAPNDKDVIEELINYTNAGKLANTPEEMADVLMNWYKEWEVNGFIAYNGIESNINEFTREHQANKMKNFINKII